MDSEYILMLILATIGLVLWRFRKDHGTALSRSEARTMLYEQAGGWVKMVDSASRPLFKGKIVGEVADEDRLLLVGVLVEENTSDAFLAAIKQIQPTCVTDGMILARCITAPNRDVVFAQLQDREIEDLISPHLKSSDAVRLCVEMNSDEIRFAEDEEGIRKYNALWAFWVGKGLPEGTASEGDLSSSEPPVVVDPSPPVQASKVNRSPDPG
ncbi:MAG: hypothetical protein WED00_15920 [Aquisalimonadaceae bacterium]